MFYRNPILSIISITNANAQIKTITDYFTSINTFLVKQVKSGKVNYKAIAADKIKLEEIITYAATKQKFTNADEKKAYYLNTYNMLVIKGIINNYPTKGPMEIKGFFDKKEYVVNGASVTLNYIENDIIRKTYNDARIHFALVCGAKSCPPIPNYAFITSKLESQLDVLTKQSIQNKNFTKIDAANNKASISMLFNWYKDDFIKSKGSVIAFLNAYLKTPIAETTVVENYTYDWALNGQ
jgi:Protein of unknown function, DUF547